MTAHPIHQSRERHACLLHDLGSHREPDGSKNSRNPTRRIPNSRLRPRTRQIHPNIMHSTSFHVNNIHLMNQRFHGILYQRVHLFQGNWCSFNIIFMTDHSIHQSRERHACLLHDLGSHREPDGSKNSTNPTRRIPNCSAQASNPPNSSKHHAFHIISCQHPSHESAISSHLTSES